MRKRRLCPTMSGRGRCWHCDGIGHHYVSFNARAIREPCPACNGVGVGGHRPRLGWVRGLMGFGLF